MRIADLFCGAGGAAKGLHDAGFEVVGFDIKPQKNYPYEFHQADALEVDLSGFDAVWASPPCQRYSRASANWRAAGREYSDLVQATKTLLDVSGNPWIIENVIGAPLERHVTLCGLMFGLRVFRHRIFESSEMLWRVPHLSHIGHSVGVNVSSPHGHGHGSHSRAEAQKIFSVAGTSGKWRGWGGYSEDVPKGTVAEWREAMGIDWMTRAELTQAIPPAYSEFLGRQLMKAIVNKEMVL